MQNVLTDQRHIARHLTLSSSVGLCSSTEMLGIHGYRNHSQLHVIYRAPDKKGLTAIIQGWMDALRFYSF